MFIQLAMEFLVAYNVIPEGPLEKKKNVTVEYLQSIKDVQGGLMLANIDTIVQNGVQSPSDAAEIIDAIASSTNAPNRFVALSCVSGSLILNSSPTLRERIPHRVAPSGTENPNDEEARHHQQLLPTCRPPRPTKPCPL